MRRNTQEKVAEIIMVPIELTFICSEVDPMNILKIYQKGIVGLRI